MIYAEQSDFIKPDITINNEKRTECSINKDKFGVDRCKLMNNANFGKQIENIKKYKDTIMLIMRIKLTKEHLK